MSVVLPTQAHVPTGQAQFELTSDHTYRQRALAVPDAYWSKERGQYVSDNPTPRAAAAIIALFPEALVRYPQLTEIRDRDYGNARPEDFATPLGIRLDVGAFGNGHELYDWQDTDAGYLAAILRRDGGAFVGWDRGLGKTTVTAAFIKALNARRTLVVSRNDVKEAVWRRQLADLIPEHELLVLPNPKRKREDMLAALAADARAWARTSDPMDLMFQKPIVLIIHYEAIALIAGAKVVQHDDGETVRKGGGEGWKALGRWDLMAYDEGHRLASYNPNSKNNTQQGRALSKLRKQVDHAINLTGSGIMNRGEDMFGQLHYILPGIYRAKWRDWNDRFIDYVNDGNRNVAIGFKAEALPTLRRELGVFMVYRKKEEVFDLPPIIHQDIELELYPEQRRVYEDLLANFWANVGGRLDGAGIVATNALAQMNLLRRIATYYPGVPSAKLDFTLHELEDTPDAQFAVFTWYKEPGHALAERLGDDVVVVDGDVPIRHRAELLRRHEAGKARVLVGSIATIGESLNLQYMHEAIRLDRDWNPQVNGQTVDRLYRHGQEARVTFRDLWSPDTVDTLRVKPNLASKESLRKAVFG